MNKLIIFKGAKVYINIFGEHGDTGKRPLKGSFDKDDKEKFSIQSLDLGKIKKIIIEHDNSGFRKVNRFENLTLF